MADTPTLGKVESPIDALRASVDAHRQATQASVDAGAAVQAERQQPPAEATA